MTRNVFDEFTLNKMHEALKNKIANTEAIEMIIVAFLTLQPRRAHTLMTGKFVFTFLRRGQGNCWSKGDFQFINKLHMNCGSN